MTLARHAAIISRMLPGDMPLIIAHRGASFDAPENTRAAFEMAWEQGADGIEGDFHLSADGQVVCIHDPTTGRTANRDLAVAASTLAELRELDFGRWKDLRLAGERIQTLNEVLDVLPAGKLLFVELKGGVEMVDAVAAIFAQSGVEFARLRLICFDAQVVAAWKDRMPAVKAHWLRESGQIRRSPADLFVETATICAAGINCEADPSIVNSDFVQRAKQSGLESAAWTVDDGDLARQLAGARIDFLTTNRPAFLRQCLGG